MIMQYQDKINHFLTFWRKKTGLDAKLSNTAAQLGVDCVLV